MTTAAPEAPAPAAPAADSAPAAEYQPDQAAIKKSQRESASAFKKDQASQAKADAKRGQQTQEAIGHARKLPDLSANVIIPILVIAAGAYLAWFAIKYWRGQGAAIWPSYPIKQILQGKGLPKDNEATAASVTLDSWESSQGGGSGTGTAAPSGPVNAKGKPQNIARMLMTRFGWPAGQEMPPLIKLWTQESNWEPKAKNPTSGALGIAQALGHGSGSETQGSLGNEYGTQYGLSVEQAKEANSGNALQQIRWGLGYIKSVYGTPEGAWAHEQSHNWY